MINAAGSLPLQNRRTLLWAVPAGAGVLAAAFAWVSGAKDWKGYARATGAAALGGLICVVRSNHIAKLLSNVADLFRKASDPHGHLSSVASYSQRLSGLLPVERDEALKAIQKSGSDTDLRAAIELELKAFDKLELVPGVLNGSVKVTDENHRQLVAKAVGKLSPSFALPVVVGRLAREYHALVIQPELHGTPKRHLDPATKLSRINAAKGQLDKLVYDEVLRQEGAAFYPRKKDYPQRSNEIVNKLQLAAAACDKGECTVDTFKRVAEDGIADLFKNGLEYLGKAQTDAHLRELEELLSVYPTGVPGIRLWSAKLFDEQAEKEARAFAAEMQEPPENPPGDDPGIQQLQLATRGVSYHAFPIFARMLVGDMWGRAAEKLDGLDLDQVLTFRDTLRELFKEGVLPRDKALLHESLDDAIAETISSRCGASLTREGKAKIGRELASLVEQKLGTPMREASGA